MIGADQLASFPKWKNPKRILELASLIVLPRATVSAGDILELATQVASILGFSTALNGDRRRLDLDGAGSIYVLDRAPMVISSTEVRKLAGENLKKIEGLVTPTVAEYIADLGLYQ
jgi:nicotinic acid mononucleotide adenylyltransferase